MVEITVSDHNEVIVIAFNGEFYLESVAYAEEIWNEQVSKRPSVVGLDCSNIRYIDSSAIGVLVKFLNSSVKEKISLIFFDLSEAVVTVFHTAKLDDFFTTMTRREFESTHLSK